MTSLSFKEELQEKLSKLTIAQDSIQSASYWLLFHKKNCAEAVKIFESAIAEANPEKKLTILYLANDVMQNARKKHPLYIAEFAKNLHNTIVDAYTETNEWYRTGKLSAPTPKTDKRELIKKLLNIWKDRNIIDAKIIEGIYSVIDKLKTDPITPTKTTEKKISTESRLVRFYHDLEKQSESDKSNHEKIMSTTKDLLSENYNRHDVNGVTSQINNSLHLLSSSVKGVETQIKMRNDLINLLQEEISNQKSKIHELQKTKDEFNDKQNRLSNIKNKLEDDDESDVSSKRHKIENNSHNNNSLNNNNDKVEPLFHTMNFGISPTQILQMNENNSNPNFIPTNIPPVNFSIMDPSMSLFPQATFNTSSNVNPNEILSFLDGNKNQHSDY